jgi:cell division protein FtsA
MFNRMMTEKYYCGLDIGSQKIKAAILEVKDLDTIKLLGVYESKIFGFSNDSISDLSELIECIHHALDQLMKKTNLKVKEVCLGVNGKLMDVRSVYAEIPLLDRRTKIIGWRDLKKINEQARLLGVKIEEDVLHDLPQHYQVDDASYIINPRGLHGRKLGVQSLMVIANTARIGNITKAVHQAGFDVDQVSFGSFAASKVVLTQQQKKNGVALIDIGAYQTSLLVFKNGVLKSVRKLSIGGDDFTKGIAQKLNLPFDLAEEIKKSYAIVTQDRNFQEEEILVKRESAYIPFQREAICQSIDPVMNQLVFKIKEALEELGAVSDLNEGVVFLGGGALLPGLIEEFEKQVNFSSNLGKIVTLPSVVLENAAVFSSAIGLALEGSVKSNPYSFNEGAHWAKQLTSKVKELYQEYF